MEDKKYLDGEQIAKDLREYCEKEFPKIVCTTKYFEQERIRMELDKGQIKKATECCATRDCDNCPYTDNKEMCFKISEAHTIIKVLLDRIEILESLNRVNDKVGEDYVALCTAYTELARTCTTFADKVKFLHEQYDALLTRNVELAEENERLMELVRTEVQIASQAITEVRADAVSKTIAIIEEKAENCGLYVANSHKPIDTIYQISKTQLDQIAQEMLEGK